MGFHTAEDRADPGDGRAQPALRRRRRRRVPAAGPALGAGHRRPGPDPHLRAVRDRRPVRTGDEAAGRRRRRARGLVAARAAPALAGLPGPAAHRRLLRHGQGGRGPARRSTRTGTGSSGPSWTAGSGPTTRTSRRTTRSTTRTSATCTGSSRPTAGRRPPDGALTDETGHGTHVAGIIAGAIEPWCADPAGNGRRTVRVTANRYNVENPHEPLRVPREAARHLTAGRHGARGPGWSASRCSVPAAPPTTGSAG